MYRIRVSHSKNAGSIQTETKLNLILSIIKNYETFSKIPTFGMKFLHNLQGQLSGFHCLIFVVKFSSESQYLISVGAKFQIISPK